MQCSKRFKELALSKGFKLEKVSNNWYNEKGELLAFKHRPDILSVQYRNRHVMTIPKRMYGFSKVGYRALDNFMFKNYFEYEHELKNWDLLIKRTPQFKEMYDENSRS